MSGRTVYAIASGKGGVGKTTTAINLGAMLADRGHEVVVVDTDLGMANLADFLEVEIEPPTLPEVLAGDDDTENAISPGPGGIDVLPSATDIEAFAKSDPTNLDAVIADLRENYDYVLLDTGAGVSYDVLVPLALADGVLLVATPDVASVRDTAKTGELADRVETEVVGAVLAQRSSDILNADDVEETLGTDVLAVIPQDEAVPMGIDAGRPLAAFAPNAPAGQAYRELAEVMIGEAEPDPELDLGSDGDVDVAFDAEPPQRGNDSGPDAGQSPNEGVGQNVEDALGESEGLLGGELASAAKEIREQAAKDPDKAAGGLAESISGDREMSPPTGRQDSKETGKQGSKPVGGEDSKSADKQNQNSANRQNAGATDKQSAKTTDTKDTRATDGQDARATDQQDVSESDGEQNTPETDTNGARSVDDLIDQHMGEDQLDEENSFGEDGSFAEENSFGDDALGGMDDDHARPDEESADALDDTNEEGSDPPRDAGGQTAGEGEGRASDHGKQSGEEDSPMEFDEGNPMAFKDSDPMEFEDDQAGPGAKDQRQDGHEGSDSKRNSESERPESSSQAQKGGLPSETPLSDEDDEDDESSGVLGRLSSLFK